MVRGLSWLLAMLFFNICQANSGKAVQMSTSVETDFKKATSVTQNRVKTLYTNGENLPNKQLFELPNKYPESNHLCDSDAKNTVVSSVKNQPDYELKGIFYAHRNHVALLQSMSGQSLIVKVGQGVGGFKVVQITEDSLRLRRRQLNSVGCWEEHNLEWRLK